ncbi:MAG: DUF4395 domain-containing protein [Candidatus Gracilibacteria bacterium]|nr:DUF4395 domain-containing protein [Candidatus Gracilibacteria bacterium]
MFKLKIGEIIPDLKINGVPAPYPVLDENAVRAGAGLMFILGMIAFVYSLTTHSPLLANIIVPILTLDLFIKVFIGPKYSPFLIMGNYLVKNKNPEWVGAKQKQFAWIIGLIIAIIVLGFLLLLGKCGPAMLLCLICLIFMWSESVLGICIGCNIYIFLRNKGYFIEEKYAPVCAGGACEIKKQKNTTN